MSGIDPAAAMAAHSNAGPMRIDPTGPDYCAARGCSIWPCEPYRLAEALTEARRRGDYTVLAESLELAERERDEAREALVVEQTTVARVKAVLAMWDADEREHLDTFGQHLPASVATCADHIRAALADQPEQVQQP